MMEGEVSLAGTPGKELTACVTLEMPTLPGPQLAPAADPVLRLPQMSVLVAEDNATNQISLASMLQALGATARIVSSGDEVLAIWQPGAFGAVLQEIAMPGRDGLSSLSAMQDKARAAGGPGPLAIAVTANAMTHQVNGYLARGCDACVAKPLRTERLAEALLACATRLRPE